MGDSCHSWQSVLSGTGRGALAAVEGLGSLLSQPSAGDGSKNGSGEVLCCCCIYPLSSVKNMHNRDGTGRKT